MPRSSLGPCGTPASRSSTRACTRRLSRSTLIPKILEQLKERNATDVLVFGGGIIPDADIPKLKEMGVAAIFTPGSSMASITDWLHQALEGRA